MGILDDYPLDFSRPELRELREMLAQLVYRSGEIEDIASTSGLRMGSINFNGHASLQWKSVLIRAREEQKLVALLTQLRDEHPALGRRIDELTTTTPVLQPGLATLSRLGGGAGSAWRGGSGREKIIVDGADTLLDVGFLELGAKRSRSICRLTCRFPSRTIHGTGSLIGPNVLLTNHHVLYDHEDDYTPADSVEAWFDFEEDLARKSRKMKIVPCDAGTIAGEMAHDWGIIETSTPPPKSAAPIDLRTRASEPRVNDYVFIIQHPEGGPKKIGLSHNLIRYVDSKVLQYWTDTRAGSSGAPVFDTRWQMVGLHHSWVEAPEEDGVAYRNQGRRIEPILATLEEWGLALHND